MNYAKRFNTEEIDSLLTSLAELADGEDPSEVWSSRQQELVRRLLALHHANYAEEAHYRVTWTEVTDHEVILTEAELRDCQAFGGVEDPENDTEGLGDGLASLQEGGYLWVRREKIEAVVLSPPSPVDPIQEATAA